MKKLLLLPAFILLLQLSVFADQLTELLISSHKIYAVVAVVAIILAGIIFFLIYLERKVSKLEQKI